MKAPKTKREARRMYFGLPVVPFKAGSTQLAARWRVTMIGAAAHVLRDNEKIITAGLIGSNTKFSGLFSMLKRARYWLLNYNNPANGWAARQIRDRVRFFTQDLAVGRFYWCHVFFFWFILVRVLEEAEESDD